MGRPGLGREGALVLAAGIVGFVSACAGPSVSRRASRPIDAAAQRSDYDLGLRRFGQEKYVEARDAWRKAVADGPATPLGRKAAEHLRKLARMLSTLKEIEDDAEH